MVLGLIRDDQSQYVQGVKKNLTSSTINRKLMSMVDQRLITKPAESLSVDQKQAIPLLIKNGNG